MPIGGDFDLYVNLPLPILDYKNIVVWLIDAKCNVFASYALNELDGHDHENVDVSDLSQIKIMVQKSVARLPKEGVCTMEVYEAVTDFDREDLQFAELTKGVLCDFYKLKIYEVTP